MGLISLEGIALVNTRDLSDIYSFPRHVQLPKTEDVSSQSRQELHHILDITSLPILRLCLSPPGSQAILHHQCVSSYCKVDRADHKTPLAKLQRPAHSGSS